VSEIPEAHTQLINSLLRNAIERAAKAGASPLRVRLTNSKFE
jgi:hypothetical protein